MNENHEKGQLGDIDCFIFLFLPFSFKKMLFCLDFQVKIHMFALYEYLQVQKYFSSNYASYYSVKNEIDLIILEDRHSVKKWKNFLLNLER